MSPVFTVFVVILAILAIVDLIVGVSNDAINFLNHRLDQKSHLTRLLSAWLLWASWLVSSPLTE